MKLILILLQEYIYLIPLVIMTMTPQELGNWVWINDIENQRPVIIVHNGLQSAADFKAKLMFETNQFGHCIENGDDKRYCPNEMAKEFGCAHHYGDDSNQIESIAKGSKNFDAIYNTLKNSESHQAHINGIGFK